MLADALTDMWGIPRKIAFFLASVSIVYLGFSAWQAISRKITKKGAGTQLEDILRHLKKLAYEQKSKNVDISAPDEEQMTPEDVTNILYICAKYGFTVVNPELYERFTSMRGQMERHGETIDLDWDAIFNGTDPDVAAMLKTKALE